jgi:hypothetical protein
MAMVNFTALERMVEECLEIGKKMSWSHFDYEISS